MDGRHQPGADSDRGLHSHVEVLRQQMERSDLTRDFEDLRREIRGVGRHLTIYGIVGLVAVASIFFAALYIWPPH
jgi:hypothetical protein